MAICICLYILPTSALALDSQISTELANMVTVDVNMTAEEALSKAYENLSDEAKVIYNSISLNVNNDEYSLTNNELNNVAVPASVMGAAEVISQGLTQMGLTGPVVQALNQLASAILAILADGPLPIGDIYALSISLYTAVTLATYWDDILDQWDDIVALFQQALTETSSTISDSMDLIKEDVISEREISDTVIVAVIAESRTIRVDNTYYVCNIPITRFGPSQERFYPAMIFSGVFWACPTYVPFKVARAIMSANIELSGVITKYSQLAYNLCGSLGTPYHHPAHADDDPNYLAHYHFSKVGREYNTHAWYTTLGALA